MVGRCLDNHCLQMFAFADCVHPGKTAKESNRPSNHISLQRTMNQPSADRCCRLANTNTCWKGIISIIIIITIIFHIYWEGHAGLAATKRLWRLGVLGATASWMLPAHFATDSFACNKTPISKITILNATSFSAHQFRHLCVVTDTAT